MRKFIDSNSPDDHLDDDYWYEIWCRKRDEDIRRQLEEYERKKLESEKSGIPKELI